MKLSNLTIGADPEMFLYNTETEQFISAIGLIPGTKEKPFKPSKLKKGFALQTDNVLVEFNIPASKLNWESTKFIDDILSMKKFISEYVKVINPNFITKCQASAHFSMDELKNPQAMIFGCSPDLNVYTNSENPTPFCEDKTMRSAGFHIHIGYSHPILFHSVELVKYLDVFLGLPSVLMDSDTDRRKLYGKAGSFRIQPWGVEYRTLSSAMLQDEDTLSFVYMQVLKAIDAYENDFRLPEPQFVRHTIDQGNVESANLLIQKYNII